MTDGLSVLTASAPLADVDTEVLILPLFREEELSPNARAVDAALDGALSEMRESGEFRAETYEVNLFPTLGRLPARRVALLGLGRRSSYRESTAVRALASAARAAGKRALYRGAVDVADLGLSPEEAARAAVEGVELSRYVPDPYRTSDRRDILFRELQVVGGPEAALREGLIRGRAKNLARELVNEPSNLLDPVKLAERAEQMAAEVGLTYRCLDQAAMEAEEMGALLAVTQGSEFPPRFIILEHRKGGDGPLLALVGKAVMFDTGGISIKPAADMGKMKGDMAGGAAVIGAMQAIAELNLPVNVIGLVPAVINMPDGRAWKPGDVITAKSGKTIETISTDAEGRMLLADGVTYARQLGAGYIVDIATLTGACAIALGQVASGLYGTSEPLIQAVRECGETAGERHWPMPLFHEYRELIRSEVADLKNSGGRLAGSITAAWFIREFAGDTPWAHLDIAGSGSSDKPRPYAPAGPTGTGVGTFINLAQRLVEGGLE